MLQNKTERKIGSIYSRHSSAPKNSLSSNTSENITEISKNHFNSINQSLQSEIAILSEKHNILEKKSFNNTLNLSEQKRDGKIYSAKIKQSSSDSKENIRFEKDYKNRTKNLGVQQAVGKICRMPKQKYGIGQILQKEDNKQFNTSRYRYNKPLNFAYTHQGYSQLNSAVQKKFNYKKQEYLQEKNLNLNINRPNQTVYQTNFSSYKPSKTMDSQISSIPLANFCKFSQTIELENSSKFKQLTDTKNKHRNNLSSNNFISTYRQQFERQHFPQQQHLPKKTVISIADSQPTKNQKIKMFQQKYHQIVDSYQKKKIELDKKIELHEQQSQFMLTVIANRKNSIVQLEERQKKVIDRHMSLSVSKKQQKISQKDHQKNQEKDHDKAILQLLERSKNMKKAIQQLQQHPKQSSIKENEIHKSKQEQFDIKPSTEQKRQQKQNNIWPQIMNKSPVSSKSPRIIRKGILESRLQRPNNSLSPLKLTRCTPDMSNSKFIKRTQNTNNKEIISKFISEFQKQIKLDQRLRAVRQQIQNHKKIEEIRSSLALRGFSKQQIALQFQEYDPYYSNNSSQLDHEKLALNYIVARKQSDDHWKDKLQQKWDQNLMKLFFQQLDFNKSGCITLKDLMRQINCLTKSNYRVRDLFKIHQKLKPITLDNFLKKLGKLEQ